MLSLPDVHVDNIISVYVAEFQLWGKSCSLRYPYVLHVLCLFVIIVNSHFGFEEMILGQIVQVQGNCLSFTFELLD